ncbi:hypothetical protein CAEBREN_02382 [Caenorhabditis brenneri]|uniref:RING-type domain-containing protein n=1 Tax=Caenorhabditis brenneri TaxID=135651 RepID=G0N7H0_CAEBE|nr:hypothetical protein CAEBREN_02382 [Caenorhabditis brenneri]
MEREEYDTRPMSVDQLMDEASSKAQKIEEKLAATQEELAQTLEKLGKVERQLAKVRTTNCVEENEKLRQSLAAANLNEHKKLIKLEKCLESLQTISECTICTSRYTTTGPQVPRVLASCGHTFCTECVNKIGKNVHNQIKCPTYQKFSSANSPKNITIIQALVPTVYRLLEGDNDLVLE